VTLTYSPEKPVPSLRRTPSSPNDPEGKRKTRSNSNPKEENASKENYSIKKPADQLKRGEERGKGLERKREFTSDKRRKKRSVSIIEPV